MTQSRLDKFKLYFEDLPGPKAKKTKSPIVLSKYEATKLKHTQAIKKLKQDIKRHKLLIKQAKLNDKLTNNKGVK